MTMKAQNPFKSTRFMCCMLLILATALVDPSRSRTSFACDLSEYGWVCDDQSVKTNNETMTIVGVVNCVLDIKFGNGTLYDDESCNAIFGDLVNLASSRGRESTKSTIVMDSESDSNDDEWHWVDGIKAMAAYELAVIACGVVTAFATAMIARDTRGSHLVAREAMDDKRKADGEELDRVKKDCSVKDGKINTLELKNHEGAAENTRLRALLAKRIFVSEDMQSWLRLKLDECTNN